MMSDKNTIPKHWQRKKLGEVCEVLDNLRKPINSSERKQRINGKSQSELFPYYGATGQVGWIDGFLTDGEFILIGEDGAPFLDIYKDKAYKIKGKTWVNNHAHILKGKVQFLIDDFALYYLNSINYREFVNGTTRLKLTKSNLIEIPFVVPPLPEQLAIVSKIEQLFSELDNGIAQLKTAQQQLKVYRQSLLKWAFERSEGNVPVKLVDACEFITKGTTPAKDKLSLNTGDIPFLKVYNLTFIGSLDFTKDPTFVPIETHNIFLKRSKVCPGDVLMNIVGPPLGKVSIVSSHYPEWNINQAIVRFRCKEKLNNKYLLYFLLSENTIRTYSRKAKATAGQFNLTLEICRDIIIPLPSLKEQLLIVSELESKLTVCDKTEETISQSLQQAETLRQSILKQAFEGNLVKMKP